MTTPNTDNYDRYAENYIYMVVYRLSEDSEFNYLAAFNNLSDAQEYKNRQVWAHLDTWITRQPVYGIGERL